MKETYLFYCLFFWFTFLLKLILQKMSGKIAQRRSNSKRTCKMALLPYILASLQTRQNMERHANIRPYFKGRNFRGQKFSRVSKIANSSFANFILWRKFMKKTFALPFCTILLIFSEELIWHWYKLLLNSYWSFNFEKKILNSPIRTKLDASALN